MVSLPCNCSRSGRSVSTMFSSVASSASTVSATLVARPLACLPSSRAVSRLRWRGDGGKNTKPTMSAPASSATSSVSRVDRPQILTSRGMVSRERISSPVTGWNRADGAGSTTSRPACLALWPHRNRTGRRRKPLLFDPGNRRRGPQIGRLRPCPAGIRLILARRAAPVALAEPGRHAAGRDPQNGHRDDHGEQRHRHRDRRIGRIEGIERHRHEMAVGDRKDDEDEAQGNDDQRREELSHDHRS